jgi:hypothetical protein
MKREPTLLVSLANRFAIRNFFRAGVYGHLHRQVPGLAFLGHPEDVDHLPHPSWPLTETRSGAVENVLNNIVFQMLARRIDNQTIAIRNRQLRRDRPASWAKKVLLSRPFGHSRPAIRGLQWLNSRLHPDRRYGACFRRLRPDLYFSTNLLDPQEAPIIRRAKAQGVPVVGQVLSWDNLSSKGLVPEPLDYYVVWNEWMGRELTDLYGVSADRIAVTGAPQFDQYHDRSDVPDRETFFARLGVDPARRLLTYTASTRRLVPHETDIVRAILEALDAMDLPPWHLRVRTHPFDPSGRWDRFPDEGHVSFEGAGTKGPRGWTPTGEDMTWFRDLLCHSDVVINAASTTTIDAAALDRPVINIAFDGTDHPDPLTSVSNFYSFHHYRRIVESGGARVVPSPADCALEVSRYIADPDRDAEGRRRIVSENCYRIDGQSARRLADALAGWLAAEGTKA